MLKLYWVRQHLRQALSLLLAIDPTLTLSDVHHHLEHAHQLLQRMQPKDKRPHPRQWERWSVILFHYRREELIRQVQEAQHVLQHKVGSEDIERAHRCLLHVHFRMLDVWGSNAG